eukprot:3186000-Pyramimonas_sp.AAC.1
MRLARWAARTRARPEKRGALLARPAPRASLARWVARPVGGAQGGASVRLRGRSEWRAGRPAQQCRWEPSEEITDVCTEDVGRFSQRMKRAAERRAVPYLLGTFGAAADALSPEGELARTCGQASVAVAFVGRS